MPARDVILIVDPVETGGDLVSTEVTKRALRVGGAVPLVKKGSNGLTANDNYALAA